MTNKIEKLVKEPEKREYKEQQYFACYKYFNDKKRRIAAFGRKIEEDKMELWTWVCDRKDTFYKKIARKFYETYIYYTDEPLWMNDGGKLKQIKPTVTIIPLDKDENVKLKFLTHLKDNFYKAYPVWKVARYQYIKGNMVDAMFEKLEATDDVVVIDSNNNK